MPRTRPGFLLMSPVGGFAQQTLGCKISAHACLQAVAGSVQATPEISIATRHMYGGIWRTQVVPSSYSSELENLQTSREAQVTGGLPDPPETLVLGSDQMTVRIAWIEPPGALYANGSLYLAKHGRAWHELSPESIALPRTRAES